MSTWLGHWCPDIWSHLSWVCPWDCFLVRLTFESVDWVKQNVHPNVGCIHPISWRTDRTKNTNPFLSDRGPFLWDCCELGHRAFPAFALKLKHQLFCNLESDGFGTGNYTIFSPEPPGANCRLWAAGANCRPSDFSASIVMNTTHTHAHTLVL